MLNLTDQLVERDRNPRLGQAAEAYRAARMSNAAICTTGAVSDWVRTPKFGPHHPFQRWRSAT